MAFDEGLLHEGEAPAKTSLTKRRLVRMAQVAAVLSFGLVAFYGGTEYGRNTPDEHVAAVNLTHLSQQMTCYSYTGQSCYTGDCDAGRGTCTVESAAWHHCNCVAPNGCTGVEGACYSEPYKKILEGVHFTNMYWDYQHMYMPALQIMDHIETSQDPISTMPKASSWTLYQLPGQVKGHTGHFLTTAAYPSYTASIRGVAQSAAYEVSLDKELEPWRLAVRVCLRGTDEPNGVVMIGSMKDSWFYLAHGSWKVWGWNYGDPGRQGYWLPDVDLRNAGLEDCGF